MKALWERATVHGRDVTEYRLYFFRQPVRDRLVAWTYHRLWETPTWRLMRALEPIGWKRHEGHCGDGCGIAYRPGDATPIPTCVYLPYTARQDLRCWRLHRRNRVELGHAVVDADLYDKVRGRDM